MTLTKKVGQRGPKMQLGKSMFLRTLPIIRMLRREILGRRPRMPRTTTAHIRLMRESWDELATSLGLGAIAFLKDRTAPWDEEEFFLVGERFVDRMVSRFVEYKPTAQLRSASILEIGCGVGRFLKPLSRQFGRVVGVDISEEMLKIARHLLSGCENVELSLNNGLDLSGFEDDSFDYCICAGVLQHITSVEVATNYIREGLRVVEPGGVFLFQFMGYKTKPVANDVMVGARLTASDLDQALSSDHFRILEISNDPIDPNATLVVVLQKVTASDFVPDSQRLFSQQTIVHKPWLSGVYDGITTLATGTPIQPGQKPRRITFFDE